MPQVVAWTVLDWFILAVTAYTAWDANQTRKRAQQAARNAYNASLKDRLVMTATADAARSRVYGRCRNVDGVLFKGTHGSHNRYYTMVVALAGHECDAIEDVYFNDELLTLASDGAGGYWVQNAPYLQGAIVSASQTMTTVGTTATVTLAHTPIAGSVACLSLLVGDGSSTIYTPTSIVGNLVTITGVDPSHTAIECSYQWSESLPKARIWKYLGTPGQDIGSDLLASRFPTLINTGANDDRFAGICSLVVEYEYSQDAFPTGLPQVSAVIRGARVQDPRTGSTAWSQNTAVIARDWSLYANGGACNTAELVDAAFIAAANACDVSTNFSTPSGVETRPLYQCDIVCKTDAQPDQWLNEIVESMAGKWGWSGGQLTLVAGVWRAPVASITEDWVSDQGSLSIVKDPPISDLVNVYRPSIADAAQNYVVAPIPEVRSAEYIAADGRELPRETSLGGVTNNVHAQHVCGVFMRDARYGTIVSMPAKMHAWPLQLFDVVYLTLPFFGIANQTFEVIGWKFSMDTGVMLVLKRIDASIYDPASSFALPNADDNTTMVLPWIVPAITGLAVVDGPQDGTQQSRALVTWDAVTAENVRQSGKVEIQYTEASLAVPSGDWPTWIEEGGATSTIIPNLRSGFHYLFKARAINTLGVRGPWSLPELLRPTVPLVDTGQIEPGAATQYLFGTPVDFTWTTPTADPRGTFVKSIANVSYTNNTGGDVLIEFTATFNITHTNPNGFSNPDFFYCNGWSGGVGIGTTILPQRLLFREILGPSENRSYSVTMNFHHVLPDGDSGTFDVLTTLDAPSVAAAASDILLRAVVIKR